MSFVVLFGFIGGVFTVSAQTSLTPTITSFSSNGDTISINGTELSINNEKPTVRVHSGNLSNMNFSLSNGNFSGNIYTVNTSYVSPKRIVFRIDSISQNKVISAITPGTYTVSVKTSAGISNTVKVQIPKIIVQKKIIKTPEEQLKSLIPFVLNFGKQVEVCGTASDYNSIIFSTDNILSKINATKDDIHAQESILYAWLGKIEPQVEKCQQKPSSTKLISKQRVQLMTQELQFMQKKFDEDPSNAISLQMQTLKQRIQRVQKQLESNATAVINHSNTVQVKVLGNVTHTSAQINTTNIQPEKETLDKQKSTTAITQPTIVVSTSQLRGPFAIGMDNKQVKVLQEYLAKDSDIYPKAIISGYYGVLTQKAVERFQRKYNIVSSGSPYTTGYGLAGPETRAKINSIFINNTTNISIKTTTKANTQVGQTQTNKTSTISILKQRIQQMLQQLQLMQKQLKLLKSATAPGAFGR